MRKFIDIITETQQPHRLDKFDETSIAMTNLRAEDINKVIKWAMTEGGLGADDINRIRGVSGLPRVDLTVEGLASGITDIILVRRMVKQITSEAYDAKRKSIEHLLAAIGVERVVIDHQTKPKTASPEEVSEFLTYDYVSDGRDERLYTDDWEYYSSSDARIRRGRKVNEDIVVSRKNKISRFPTITEYTSIFGNDGW